MNLLWKRAVYPGFWMTESARRQMVEGSNYADIGFQIDPRTNRIILMGAIDNLVKGAAGQAVQNMNLLLDTRNRKAWN